MTFLKQKPIPEVAGFEQVQKLIEQLLLPNFWCRIMAEVSLLYYRYEVLGLLQEAMPGISGS